MAQQFYSREETAQLLGISVDDVTAMFQQGKLHGIRSGSDWKFKTKEVDELVQQGKSEAAEEDAGEAEGDVLLSEVELGASDPSTSGTVIGGTEEQAPAHSDVQLASDSDLSLGDPVEAEDKVDSAVSQFEELDELLDDDMTLSDSGISLAERASDGEDETQEVAAGDSDIDLGAESFEDDDVVLGGSGTGSDITIGGDSGISLVDPADSGLSLDDPLEFSGADESLELGEDDMLTLSEETDPVSPTEVKADEDFLLTPLEELGDEDTESDSQVISLDETRDSEEAATVVAQGDQMEAMLGEEELPVLGDLDAGAGDPLGMGGTQPGGGYPGTFPQGGEAAVLPEVPYGIGSVLSLALCVIILAFCGMFTYDILRNMWSWDSTFSFNSPIMDWILSQFS